LTQADHFSAAAFNQISELGALFVGQFQFLGDLGLKHFRQHANEILSRCHASQRQRTHERDASEISAAHFHVNRSTPLQENRDRAAVADETPPCASHGRSILNPDLDWPLGHFRCLPIK
jgi:hypothetical protein